MKSKLIFILVILSLVLSTSFAQRPTVGGEANDFTLVNSAGEVVSLSDLRGTPLMLNFWATWCVPCREELPFFQETYDQINGTHAMSDSHVITDEMPESEEMAEPEEMSNDESSDAAVSAADNESNMIEMGAKKVEFVILNNNEEAEKANAFLEEIGINLLSLVDASKDEFEAFEDSGTELDKTKDVVRSYRVRGMPTTFYIDADGVIQVIKQGLITPQSMQEDLAKIGIDWQPVIEGQDGS